MEDTYACDYCRAVIDTASDDSLIVEVRRRVDRDEWGDEDFVSGGRNVFRFCSQAHLATYMERTPLPAARSDDDSEDLGVVASCLLSVFFGLVFIALAAGSVYGLYLLVQDLL